MGAVMSKRDYFSWGGMGRWFLNLGVLTEFFLCFFALLFPETWVTTNFLRLILLVLKTCRIYKKCECFSSNFGGLVGRMASSWGRPSLVAAPLFPLDQQSEPCERGHLLGAVGDKRSCLRSTPLLKPLSSSWAVSDGRVQQVWIYWKSHAHGGCTGLWKALGAQGANTPGWYLPQSPGH